MLPIPRQSSHSNRWNFSYTQKAHQRKLQEIKDNRSSLIDNRAPESRKILPLLRKGIKEQLDIQKENLVMLGRLASILSGKNKKYMTLPSSFKSGPPSLNFFARKKEAERISGENELLVKRLREVPSNIPRAKVPQSISKPSTTILSKSEKHFDFKSQNK